MISTIARVVTLLAGAALITLALIICLDVALRSGGNAPLKGLFEISQLVFACIMAFAFAYANWLRRHVTMELAGHLTARKEGLNFFASFVALVIFCLLTYLAFQFSADKSSNGETTLVLGAPLAPFWYVASIAMTLASLGQFGRLLADFLSLLRGLKNKGTKATYLYLWRECSLPLAAWIFASVLMVLLLFLHQDMSAFTIVLIAFAALYVLIFTHVPIGIAMAVVGLTGCYALLDFEPALLVGRNQLTSSLSSADLAAIPLFLIMGNLAIDAGFADDIFKAASLLFGRLRGGHAIATIIGCAGFGAISGSSVATTATIGSVAFKEMQKRKYTASFSTGSIAAGGTLGALIPPSVILIIYCVIAEQSISTAFMAALFPALLALCLYVGAIMVMVRLRPNIAPQQHDAQSASFIAAVICAWRPALLFFMVVGGLYGGFFTVQEAAAIGVGLAFIFLLVSGHFSFDAMSQALTTSMVNSAILYILIIGASIFGAFLNLAGITNAVIAILDPTNSPIWFTLLILIIMYLILGSAFDAVAALLVTVPFVIPIIITLEYDLIWWGIITLTLVEIGMITPPIGMNVFVMKSMAGDGVSITTIFKGVIPFLIADLLRLLLLISFPIITLWLPSILS